MSEAERLNRALRDAILSRDQTRQEMIRLVRAAVGNAQQERGHTLSVAEVHELIARQISLRRETLAMFGPGQPFELRRRWQEEWATLESLLPGQTAGVEGTS
ncbi:MAG: GatB/YqeY domain-containing protein [Chloroflexi bacterium]|nr:GatB/YqeY domain-containing protein [Chloroflexota bacterium]